MVGIGAVALVRADLRRRVALMVLCLGIVAFLAGLSVQGVGDVLAPGKGWEGVATAQNRMPLWQVIIGGVKERPLLGWGFGVGAKTYSVAELNQYVLGAHNLLLEVLLNTGAVGLGIFLVAVAHLLFAVYREALRAQPGSAGVFAATVGALVNGLSGVPVCGTVWVPVAFAFFFMYGFFEFSIRGTGRYMPAEQLPLGARRQYGYGMRARTST
jgi:O-antigen ligase